jgi:hypothetical protein
MSPTTDMERSYYIYAHIRGDNGEIVYIGKGTKNRLLKSYGRNKYWKNIAAKYSLLKVKLVEGLDEKAAYATEIAFISFYKSVGLSKANVSLGGTGVTVEKRWWSEKISKAMKGRNTGIGEASRSWKPFISKRELRYWYVEKGETSPQIAARYGVSYTTVTTRLKRFGLLARPCGQSAKAIKCLEDGKIYPSIAEAARAYGVYRENLRKVLKGDYKTTGNHTFSYAN